MAHMLVLLFIMKIKMDHARETYPKCLRRINYNKDGSRSDWNKSQTKTRKATSKALPYSERRWTLLIQHKKKSNDIKTYNKMKIIADFRNKRLLIRNEQNETKFVIKKWRRDNMKIKPNHKNRFTPRVVWIDILKSQDKIVKIGIKCNDADSAEFWMDELE